MAQEQKFQAATLAPDVLARQLKLQQDQVTAQRMMENGGMPQGQMVGNHFVAPSWTQYLASALNSGIGAYKDNEAQKGLASIETEQAAARQAQVGKFVQGMAGKGGMSPEQMALAAQLMGPEKFAAEMVKQQELTNEQKNLGFMTPEQRNTAIGAEYANKAGLGGVQNTIGADGRVTAQAVPGYAGIQAGQAGLTAGAQEAAKSQFDLIDVPDGQGGTIKMPRYKAVQALGGQGQGPAQGQPAQPGAVGQPAPGQPGGLGTTPSELVMTARSELPKVTQQADQMISSIDGILNHPGLDGAVGLQWGASNIPGTPEADFVARSEQLQGQAFLQAFESLKGGGQITEVEGKKAEQAIARLTRTQSEASYKQSLTELRGVLTAAKQRAMDKAGMPAPAGGQKSAAGRKPVKTGTYNGRKVVQYDDGTMSYAE